MTTAMASAAPTRPVSALETRSRPGGISGTAGGAGSVGAAVAGSPPLFFFGCPAKSIAPGPASPRFIPSNGSLSSAPLNAPSVIEASSAAAAVSSDAAGEGGSSAGGGGGRLALTGPVGGFGGGGPEGSSFTSMSMSSKFGIGFAAAGFETGPVGGLDEAGGAMSASGASPVNSAMPKRSSASSRRAVPFGLRAAVAGAGREAVGAGRAGAGREAPAGRAAAGAGREVAPGRAAGRATAAAPSEDRSIVWPGPGAGSLDDAPGLRTWKTFLHDV